MERKNGHRMHLAHADESEKTLVLSLSELATWAHIQTAESWWHASI